MILYPSLEEALELHAMLIKRFGGKAGVRDMGLLESALYRPQTGYYQDLPEMAAALMESLLLNHPFIDGNKRMAFFLTDVFLRMNGYKLKVEAKAGLQFIERQITTKALRYNQILVWIKKHAVK